MTLTAKLFLPAGANLGEGPMWDERSGKLYWVDIWGEKLHRSDPVTGADEVFEVGQPVGTVVLGESGAIYLAVQHGFVRFDLDSGALDPIADPEAHLPGNRFNDGKCDPAGRFWAGTMGLKPAFEVGALYRLDPDRRTHKMVSNVTVSNGIAWSADKRSMYYIDSGPHTVSQFDYDNDSGAITQRRTLIQVPTGMGAPDGMALDVEGKLWIAHYGGSCVRRWDPDTGQVLDTISVPTARVTACAFGGPQMDTLFITTAKDDQRDPASDPNAGHLFTAHPGTRGQMTFRFADR